MAKEYCSLKEKLSHEAHLNTQEIQTILSIVRKEMNFLIKNNIPLTPQNYERWFYVFCYIVENNLDPNDFEILALFKELYEHSFQSAATSLNNEQIAKKLSSIAQMVEKDLAQVIEILQGYNGALEQKKDRLQTQTSRIEDRQIQHYLETILEELHQLHEDNKKLTEEIRHYHEEILQLQRELKSARTEAEKDPLTELLNQRGFEKTITQMIEEFHHTKIPFTLILMQIDNFDRTLSEYSHQIGEQLLKEIAMILKTFLRSHNILARLDGATFAILAPKTTKEEGKKIAMRLASIMKNHTFNTLYDQLKLSATFGVTQVNSEDNTDSLLQRGFKALQKAYTNDETVVVI